MPERPVLIVNGRIHYPDFFVDSTDVVYYPNLNMMTTTTTFTYNPDSSIDLGLPPPYVPPQPKAEEEDDEDDDRPVITRYDLIRKKK